MVLHPTCSSRLQWTRGTAGTRRAFRALARRRLISAVTLLSLLIFLLRRSPQDSDKLETGTRHERLHFLITLDGPYAEVCKCIVTSAVLGYPTPTLIRSNNRVKNGHEQQPYDMDGTQATKIIGIEMYLHARNSTMHKNDLLLVVDGHDSWFQLPPSVLLSRFDRITHNNFERTQSRMGSSAIEVSGAHESILFAAESKCGPEDLTTWDANQYPMCYAVPQSPLRDDMLASGMGSKNQGRTSHHINPRYLNSGLMIGRPNDMSMMLDSAHKLISVVGHGGNNQLIFQKLFGEQSYLREVVRLEMRSSLSRAKDAMSQLLGFQSRSPILYSLDHPNRVHMNREDEAPPERGMGLDYTMEIALAASSLPRDAGFFVYNTTDNLHSQRIAAGMSTTSPIALPLPGELLASERPFKILDVGNDATLQELVTTWAEVPLYTSALTGAVPVVIRTGAGDADQTLWSGMWYHQRLRALLLARAHKNPIGAFDTDGSFLTWNELCGDQDADVFQDNLVS